MEQIITMLEDIMEVDEGTLREDTVLADIEEWESLAKLSLMVEAKKNYEKTLTAAQIREFVTVSDIGQALL